MFTPAFVRIKSLSTTNDWQLHQCFFSSDCIDPDPCTSWKPAVQSPGFYSALSPITQGLLCELKLILIKHTLIFGSGENIALT